MAVGSWWLRTAVTAALLAARPCAVIAQNSPTTTAVAGPSTSPQELAFQIQRDLQAKLTSPRSTQAERDEAAKRLLSRTNQSARDDLLQAIKATGPAAHDQRVAVAKAIADASSPDPQFIPALQAMLGPDRPSTEAAATALVRYSDNVAVEQSLLDFARDARQPAASREAAARALGNVTLLKRPVAQSLVNLAADNAQPLAVRNAAMDALGDCTGFPFGHDAAPWRQWLAAAPQNDPAWTAHVAARHAAHEQQVAREKDAYAKALEGIISSQYQALSGADRADERGQLILNLLNDADPHVRVLGITYCTNAFRRTQGYPPAANDRIQNLLGDSNVDVRLEAARAVQELNLVNALDPLLAQLINEPNADVRDAMVGALGHIGSPRALPTLLSHLADPSLHVATTAAYWLGELAAPLRDNNPQQADQISGELWKAQNNQPNRDKDAVTFRATCIEAIGKLKDSKLDDNVLHLAERVAEPVGVRVAAYHALASPRNRRAAIKIAGDLLNENNKEVRIAQISALAGSGKFEEEANFLYGLTQPTEPDAQVRAAAWDAFKTLLPTATDFANLTDWSTRLADDPARQLAVLDTLTQKLKDANRMADWAPQEQNVGTALMNLAEHDQSPAAAQTHYNQAAAALLSAVDYWNKSGQQSPAMAGLSKQAMQSLLKAHDYNRACTFAADQIKASPNGYLNGILAPEIRDYADHLVSDAKKARDPQKLKDAIDFIDQATKIDPPLERPVLSDLDQFKADAQNAVKALPRAQ